MHLRELKEKKIGDFVEMGKELGIENAGGMRKQDLIFAVLQKKAEKDEHIYVRRGFGVLPDGFGFLGRLTIIICQVRMTFMFLHLRFVGSGSNWRHCQWLGSCS